MRTCPGHRGALLRDAIYFISRVGQGCNYPNRTRNQATPSFVVFATLRVLSL